MFGWGEMESREEKKSFSLNFSCLESFKREKKVGGRKWRESVVLEMGRGGQFFSLQIEI